MRVEIVMDLRICVNFTYAIRQPPNEKNGSVWLSRSRASIFENITRRMAERWVGQQCCLDTVIAVIEQSANRTGGYTQTHCAGTMMRSVGELMSFANPLLGSFIFWSALLAFKTALMSFLPTLQPFLTKVECPRHYCPHLFSLRPATTITISIRIKYLCDNRSTSENRGPTNTTRFCKTTCDVFEREFAISNDAFGLPSIPTINVVCA